MGIPSLAWYGNVDLGSAIETVETIIAKLKTNKFDNSDLVEFKKALAEIDIAISDEK